MYQPKLYLRFEPAIENDTIGISQLNKILYIIGLEYPETKWFRGNEAASFNPFTDYEDGEIANQIRSLTIGYWPDMTDRITYGQWDDNDEGYTNAIDGWEWFKERDINLDTTNSIFDSLTEGKKKKKEKKEYKPKLNLFFNPPIMDSEEFHRIMIAIEARYPKVRWIGGLDEKPTDWNPFINSGMVTKETEENGVHLIIVGNDKDEKNELSYSSGEYKTNYETKDGWKWYNKKGYVDTESIFDSLNESESNTIPNVTFSFEPPIEEPEELKRVLYVLNTIYPGLEWVNDQSVLTYDIYNEVFHYSRPGDKWPDVVGGLSIGHFEEHPNQLSWSSYADPSEHKNLVDGWEVVDEHSIDTESIFNQLNESTRQPKLNLRFEDGISDANELDKVLQVLNMVYPGLKWTGDDPITTHNVIRDQEEGGDDFEYDPIYYLTIGYFSHAPDKLTYTSGPADDIDFADSEQHNYNWVEGWQWVKDNEINYDKTTDIFNQLNESYDFLKTTSLIGYSFKAVATDPNYWVIRHVFNDKDGYVTVTMEYSKTWHENIGIEGFPTTKTIEKDKVIDFVNSGKWEIVGLPVDNNTFDTFDIFDKLNESKYFFIRL